jgi:hypothetical protein
MQIKIEDLAPKARELAEKIGHKGNIAEALKQDPSLVEGLDEYQQWRDQQNREEGERIGQDSRCQSLSHEAGAILKGIKPPSQKRKKK